MADAYRSLQPPPSDKEARLQQRLAILEEKAFRIENGRGRLIYIDQIAGESGSYSATFAGTTTINPMSTGVQNLSLVYTPPLDVIAEISCNIGIVQKHDAAYHYNYGGYALSPADMDGEASKLSILTQHQGGPAQFGFRTVTGLHPLNGGTTYTISGTMQGGNGGTWSYYRDAARLWLSLKAWIA